MDSSRESNSQYPIQEPFFPRHRNRENLDRFIPNREAMDIGYANSVLTERRKGKENQAESSASSVAYQKLLAETLNKNRRILTFKNKPPAPIEPIPRALLSPPDHKAKCRTRRHICQTAEKILDAPDLSDDFYLNLLDWGSNNILAIALGSTVYLWDASNSSTSELVTVSDDDGPVTSISWAADGRHIALGLNNACVELWDTVSVKLLRKLKSHHERVGSLAWNKEILTTGSRDGIIINNDVRVRSHIVQTFLGHQQEVCGLKWSASGQQLASGGNDSLIFIWDRSFASTNAHWLHRLQDHTSAVKALAWCPFQANLLASGGGVGDDTIKFWNAHTGSCLNSVSTGSQVCALLWNSHDRELLSSHGFFAENQLILWKYPSMVRLAELSGHTSRVLYMTQSPDGFTVASAGDETLRFWNVFGIPEVSKSTPKQSLIPFSPRYHCIR